MTFDIAKLYYYVFHNGANLTKGIPKNLDEKYQQTAMDKKKQEIQDFFFTSGLIKEDDKPLFRKLLCALKNQPETAQNVEALEKILFSEASNTEGESFSWLFRKESLATEFKLYTQKYLYFTDCSKEEYQVIYEQFVKLYKLCKIIADVIEKNNDRDDTVAPIHAFKILAIFGCDPQKLMHQFNLYLQRHSANLKKPIHDTLVHVLPKNKNLHLDNWRKLIFDNGNKALVLFKLAVEIEDKLERGPASYAEMLEIAKTVRYQNAASFPELADLCIEYQISEKDFETCLKIHPGRKKRDNLPDVVIDGATLGFNRYYLVKLPIDDPRAYILGAITNCCQSIGGHSESCVIDGITKENNGFYVLLKQNSSASSPNPFKDGKIDYQHFAIAGQAYAWLSQNDNLVLDSWENKTPVRDDDVICVLLKAFSEKVTTMQGSPICRVLIGQGGKTPEKLSEPCVKNPEKMLEGKQYGDSTQQALLYCNEKKRRANEEAFIDAICKAYQWNDVNVKDKLQTIFANGYFSEMVRANFEKIASRFQKIAELLLSVPNNFYAADDHAAYVSTVIAKLIKDTQLDKDTDLLGRFIKKIDGLVFRVSMIFKIANKLYAAKIAFTPEAYETLTQLNRSVLYDDICAGLLADLLIANIKINKTMMALLNRPQDVEPIRPLLTAMLALNKSTHGIRVINHLSTLLINQYDDKSLVNLFENNANDNLESSTQEEFLKNQINLLLQYTATFKLTPEERKYLPSGLLVLVSEQINKNKDVSDFFQNFLTLSEMYAPVVSVLCHYEKKLHLTDASRLYIHNKFSLASQDDNNYTDIKWKTIRGFLCELQKSIDFLEKQNIAITTPITDLLVQDFVYADRVTDALVKLKEANVVLDEFTYREMADASYYSVDIVNVVIKLEKAGIKLEENERRAIFNDRRNAKHVADLYVAKIKLTLDELQRFYFMHEGNCEYLVKLLLYIHTKTGRVERELIFATDGSILETFKKMYESYITLTDNQVPIDKKYYQQMGGHHSENFTLGLIALHAAKVDITDEIWDGLCCFNGGFFAKAYAKLKSANIAVTTAYLKAIKERGWGGEQLADAIIILENKVSDDLFSLLKKAEYPSQIAQAIVQFKQADITMEDKHFVLIGDTDITSERAKFYIYIKLNYPASEQEAVNLLTNNKLNSGLNFSCELFANKNLPVTPLVFKHLNSLMYDISLYIEALRILHRENIPFDDAILNRIANANKKNVLSEVDKITKKHRLELFSLKLIQRQLFFKSMPQEAFDKIESQVEMLKTHSLI